MVSIAPALLRIKQELGVFLPDEMILAACREAGHKWRERQLGPVQRSSPVCAATASFQSSDDRSASCRRAACEGGGLLQSADAAAVERAAKAAGSEFRRHAADRFSTAGEMVRPAGVSGGWFQHDRAGHAFVTESLRATHGVQKRLRLSGAQDAGAL